MNPLHILFLLFFIFGLQISIHSEPPKQVSIGSRFIANSSKLEPEILAAPMITTLLGQEAVICITQEKRSGGVDKKSVDGIRTRIKVLETTNGLFIQGYVFVGMHDPVKLDQEVEILGLFEEQPIEHVLSSGGSSKNRKV